MTFSQKLYTLLCSGNILNGIRVIFIKKLINSLLKSDTINQSMVGKVSYQELFERLHRLSIMGMNIGNGASPENSGEVLAIAYIFNKLHKLEHITIFDVGANVGEYVVLLERYFKNASIYCFEPSINNYSRLLSNTKDFNNLNYYNFGFGSHSEKVTLFSEKSESALASLYNRKLDHFNIEMSHCEEVDLRTVDEFCEENFVDYIHFMKIDVEGHEMQVLNGAKKLLDSGKVDFIQFEFGGCNIDSKTYFQDFFYQLKDRYTIYRIVQDGLYKIDFYKEDYELFLTTNFLAERIAL
ncbi:FkbM family methyltransferase [Spirosoma sp. BT702]|uniref:FkbM family methyltransferase n=1 Tax=Spirosoma profusum TaxID=2771354 RepID=A0A927AQJ9_9BACT|nr:FkbM family methyltransferase [Spirosoma profusum]MBD2700678.1 FkbM family methyltransferase [Spirosoma profusum]